MTDVLPRWDLTHLYSSHTGEDLKRDMQTLSSMADVFHRDYYQKVAINNTASWLHTAIQCYERIEELMGKLSSYADLLFSTDADNPDIASTYQNINEFVQRESSKLIFFELEINRIDDAQMHTMLQDTALSYYRPWLEEVRSFKPYQLEEKLEQLMSDSSVASRQNWVRLYDTLLDTLEISIDGVDYTLAEALDFLSHADAVMREKAAHALFAMFSRHQEQITLIYNTIIKDETVSNEWRGFALPTSSRNVANRVEDAVVARLADTVTQNFSALSHRYYAIKAKMLGKKALNYWDRNAPLPDADDSYIPWTEAQRIVLEAYEAFSPEMARIGKRFFDEGWIDAPVKKGKTSGAFSHPVVPSAHPYILMNYQGKVRDVMTLAHELGHGVHQVLSAEQGALMADTPLTLAETASVFGEQLTFQYLLKQEKNPAARTCLIASKVEDMLNTVVRQIAFYNFETQVHAARAEGEVSAETIAAYWMDTQQESFGDSIMLDDSYKVFWTYISHFFHAPFYVYAYAFGDCLVNSLYAVYEDEKRNGKAADFEKKYLEMLKAGGTKGHKELLAPFNIDITHADFWQKGLNHIASMIDMLDNAA
jgi:oligoendopeptidase F